MKKILLGFLFCSGIIGVKAQNNAEFSELLFSTQSDVVNYLREYTRPIVVSTSNGLANGWYVSGKPHKLFGFDISVNTAVAVIPDADYSFLFNGADYDRLSLASGEPNLPTVVGDANPTQQLQIDGAPGTFNAPAGLGIDIPVINPGMPVPMANVGVGLPKNTELRVKFLPVSNIGDDISLEGTFGVGVLHDIKQWIPGMKLVPIDISAFLGFNRFAFNYDDGENLASFSTNATTFQVVAAKKLLFFTPYIGAGFNVLNSNVTYEYTGPENVDIERVDIDYDNLGGARLTVGAQLKILWVLALNVDYTFQKYNTVNVGFGINIR